MDQTQYEKQHEYLARMQEVPTKLMTLNKELDLLDHHVSTIEFKLQMLDDMILKAQAIERRLGDIQYFLADDFEPIPSSPRDDTPTTFASNVAFASNVTFETDRAEVDARFPVMNAPGNPKYGKTV